MAIAESQLLTIDTIPLLLLPDWQTDTISESDCPDMSEEAERLRNLELERKVARARALELKRQIQKETKRKKRLLSKTRRFTSAELFSAARRAEMTEAEGGVAPP